MDLEQVGNRNSFDDEIREFWLKATKPGGQSRINLLLEMATVKVDSKRPCNSIRDEFKVNRYKSSSKCFVCGGLAYESHHVILIKNGGTNQGGNIVSLCLECHNIIHPWLNQNRKPMKRKPLLRHVYNKERSRRRTNNK